MVAQGVTRSLDTLGTPPGFVARTSSSLFEGSWIRHIFSPRVAEGAARAGSAPTFYPPRSWHEAVTLTDTSSKAERAAAAI